MTELFFWLLAIILLTKNAYAGNYELEGTATDGYTIVFNTEPPATVAFYKRSKDGSLQNYQSFKSEGCKLYFPKFEGKTDKPKFSCSVSGKSPLAGTTYILSKRIGEGKDCMEEAVYDIYKCVSGCDKSKRTPKQLKMSSDCC